MCKRFSSAVIAGAVSAFVCIAVPFQSYLGSRDLFDFSWARLLLESGFAAICCAFVLYGFLRLVNRRIGVWAHAFLFGLLVCFYLEVGLLSIGLPPINGVSGFSNIIRSGLDGAVWLGCILSCCVFRHFLLRHLNLFVLSIMVLALASVFDAGNVPKVRVQSPLAGGFCSRYNVLKNVQWSAKRNVIMFILDMTPAKIMAQVMRDAPELHEKFQGFMAFEGNVGMHQETASGLPGLMTGVYLDDKISRPDYGMSIYGEQSCLYPYVAADDAVYFFGGLHQFGYTNRLRERVSLTGKTASAGGSVFFRPSTSIPFLRLWDALVIRVTPFHWKNQFLNAALAKAHEISGDYALMADEKFAFDILKQSPLSNEGIALVIAHTYGLHWPMRYDRKGNPLPTPLTTDAHIANANHVTDMSMYRHAMCEYGYCVLNRLGAMLDHLREINIYDNATIIVATDHGCEVLDVKEGPTAANAILWVKPAHNKYPFIVDSAPTSSSKVRDLICQARTKDLSCEEVRELLSQEKRMYRDTFLGKALHAFGGKLHYKDWIYDRQGKIAEVIQH